jgi:hypothetical protein
MGHSETGAVIFSYKWQGGAALVEDISSTYSSIVLFKYGCLVLFARYLFSIVLKQLM